MTWRVGVLRRVGRAPRSTGRHSAARRRLELRRLLAGVAVVVASSCLVVWSGPAYAASGSGTGAGTAAPLRQAWTTAQGTWAVLPVGNFAEPNNTFWQLLFRPAGSSTWKLVTPPGVATNGGLSTTPGSGTTVTIGVQPSIELAYSPLARTGDAGTTWASGVLAASLLRVPDALATSSGGSSWALERPRGGTLVEAQGSLTRWRVVATRARLASTAAGRACGLAALSAVAVPGGAGGMVEIGASCSREGVVGILSDQGGRWQEVGPRLGAEASSTMRVLQLEGSPSGTVALIEARRGSKVTLLVLWRSAPGQRWSVSHPLAVHGRIVATDESGGAQMAVVTAGAGKAPEAFEVTGPGRAWSALERLPRGSQVVAASTAGFVALAVSRSWVTEWQTPGPGAAWQRQSRFEVPIQYGSST